MAHLDVPNSAFGSCCQCRKHSHCSKAASVPDEYPFCILKHSAIALKFLSFFFFLLGGQIHKRKLRQENPEIATECSGFSVQLFVTSGRRERNSLFYCYMKYCITFFLWYVYDFINVLAFQIGVLKYSFPAVSLDALERSTCSPLPNMQEKLRLWALH